MIAIAVRGGAGAAEALYAVRIETPRPGPGQVLIKVAAAGVNRPDLLQRQGGYPPPPGAPATLGLEVAGEVVALGEGVSKGEGRWRLGDRVCALLGGGGYAQYAVADARHALPIPDAIDSVEAACLPEVCFTVFHNVFERGGLAAGQTLLVHGATSGIGVTAIQMGKAAGARVIATGRGADKAKTARELGADIAIDSTAEDFVAVVREAGGAAVILDMVAGDYAARNLACLNTDGRLVQIAVQAGDQAAIDMRKLMVRRLTVTGSTLRPRSADDKARLAGAVEARVWPWIEQGLVRPLIDRRFALEEAGAAHAHLEAGRHVGKVVLVV
jgi:putative PIG3 family NAD(P)H quinone oxidoreductase